ncbi:MAP7 domain-containing protein 1-like isoform X4 [Artemia franciscana]|uniref:MAP7 domain-containing protein 1-like isoform X4 n=1 Tax=Artemia franciscana TaxID=6661 RepID=UPI0032DA80FF
MFGGRMICLGDSSILYKLNNDDSVNNLCLWRQGLSNYEGDEDQLLLVPASALSMDSDWLRADLADIVTFAELSRIDNPPDVVKSHRIRKQSCDLPVHKSVSVSSTYLRSKEESKRNLSLSSSVLKRDSNSNLVEPDKPVKFRKNSCLNSKDSIKRLSNSVVEKPCYKGSANRISPGLNNQVNLDNRKNKASHCPVTRKTSAPEVGSKFKGLSHNRQRTPRQMDDKFRKLEEIKQQAAATQRLIEEQGVERQRRADDLRRRDTERRSYLETRKSVEPDREMFRRDERELRHEVKRKHEQGSIALAFNSISPQKFDEGDSGLTRRSTSTFNVSASVPSSDEKSKNVVRTSSASVSNENRYRNRAKSLLGLDAAGIADEPMSQSFHGGSSAFRRRTDIMPTIPSPHRDLRPRSAMRSGDVTPVVPSRPLSAMSYRSHSGSSGAVSMRQRPLVSRRPRPASMAGTGILLSTPEQQKDKNEKKGEESKAPKARLPTVGPKPYRAKSMDVLGTSPKPLSVHKRPKPATPRAAESHKSEIKTSGKSTEVLKAEKVAIKQEPKGARPDMKVKPFVSDKAKTVQEMKPTPKAGPKTKSATSAKAKPLLQPKVEVKEEPIDPTEESVPLQQTALNTTEPLIKAEPEVTVDVKPSVEQMPLPIEEPKAEQNAEASAVEDIKEEPRSVINVAANPMPAPVPAPAAISVAVPASVTLSPSAPEFQPGKPKITSEEEAKAAIAEKRRLAREQMEKEAELERQRLEAERLAEEERLRQEEEQARKDAEEMDRLVKEAKEAEEERLRIAIEEAERREAEETRKREEEARLKAEKEIADMKAKEEAEKLRKENEERLRKEEEARIERKKRVEAIMSRTRGAKQGQGENSGDDKSLSSVASSDPSSGPVSLVDERAEDQIQPLMEEELVAKKNEINLKKEQEARSFNDPNEVNGNSSELNGVNGHGKENNGDSSLNGGSALINFNSLDNDINSEIKDKSIIGAETLVELNQEIVKPVTRESEAADLLM